MVFRERDSTVAGVEGEAEIAQDFFQGDGKFADGDGFAVTVRS